MYVGTVFQWSLEHEELLVYGGSVINRQCEDQSISKLLQ